MANMTSAQLAALTPRVVTANVSALARASGHDPLSKLNKTERRFCARLDSYKARKLIRDFTTQAVTLHLAHDCRFTPDNAVIEADGTFTFYDVKGFEREDAVLKMRIAAERFPWFRFRMIVEDRKCDSWRVTRRFNDDQTIADVS